MQHHPFAADGVHHADARDGGTDRNERCDADRDGRAAEALHVGYQSRYRTPGGRHARPPAEARDGRGAPKNSERRTAISRFGLRFKVYRLSEDADERQAYEALNLLWRKHRLVYPLNVQKLTGATDNFLNDLTKSPYADAVQRLHLQTDVDAIRAANEAYRTHAAQRRANEAQRTPVDVGVMRRAITEDYTRLSLYLAVMADAYPEVEAWSRTLSGLNILRKHYAELLARRAGARRAKKNAAALAEAAAESTAPSTFATNP